MKYRLTVLSDSHRCVENIKALLPVINSSDYLIFCGDGAEDLSSIQGSIVVPMVCVRGNNDYADLSETACFDLGETRVLVTHGHKQRVKFGLSGILATAKLNGCRLVLYGHTHVFSDKTVDGVRLICPGAVCNGSYATVICDGGKLYCWQERINGCRNLL